MNTYYKTPLSYVYRDIIPEKVAYEVDIFPKIRGFVVYYLYRRQSFRVLILKTCDYPRQEKDIAPQFNGVNNNKLNS